MVPKFQIYRNLFQKKFKKPTIAELAIYFTEIEFQERPEVFFDFYESKGWKIGKNPMKDWKAAARTWKNHARETFKKKEPEKFQ